MLARDEDELLKEVALRNASSILKARQRVESELLQARDALERKTEELALSLSRMKATLDSATDGILVTDHHLRITDYNEKFVQMWQLPQAVLDTGDHQGLLQTLSARFDDPVGFRIRIDEIYRTAPPTSFDLLARSDGRVFERQSRPQVVAGHVVGRVWSYRDITEQRTAQEALRSSNQRLELATDASGLGLFTWDVGSDQVTWHNDRLYEMFGIPKEDGPINAGRFASEFLHPDDAPAFSKSIGDTLERGAAFYFQGRVFRGPDRHVRWVEFTGTVEKTANGLADRVVGTAADITARKQAEERLKESEGRLRQLANTIPNLVWMANADGWIHWYNDRWYAYTGTTPQEMEGWGWQKVHDALVLPDVMTQWTEAIRTGQPFEMTFPLRSVDGTFRPFLTLVAPLRNSTGDIVQWFGTNTDVSILKKAEAELREAGQRKDEFLAMLAHELRNPLAPIRNAAELLRRLGSEDQRITKASEIIGRQVNHMSSLLNDLLDVSRVTRGLVSLEREKVDLATVIAAAVEQVRPQIESKHHVLTLKNCQPGTFVFASPVRLIQIVANLLDNAAKYSDAGGTITLEVRNLDQTVQILVRDSGIGISAELLPHVFEPFSQGQRAMDRHHGGLGLGLAVVKGLVALHSGTITASSDGVDKGSQFVVTFPLYQEPGGD